MCGIVCYLGAGDGITHVINALDLLAYRAPDSSGLAVLDAAGQIAVRRAVGTARQLQDKLSKVPLPPLSSTGRQIVVAHGRWAMVGAVNETNAHPIRDRSGARVICENGSHDATMMINALHDQETWWQERGLPAGEPVHHTQNTSEVLVCEWERLRLMQAGAEIPADCREQLSTLQNKGIMDAEEIALRLAVWRLRQGNTHACAFYSHHRPDTLFITSHHKPIAILTRTLADGAQVMMVASDINAGLMLWSPTEVAEAAAKIESLRETSRNGRSSPPEVAEQIQAITSKFTLNVVYLDHTVNDGREIFARIDANDLDDSPMLSLTTYQGDKLSINWQQVSLNPAMVGKRGFPSYTESHIAEIPAVIADLCRHYLRAGMVSLTGIRQEDRLIGSGVNKEKLVARFGAGLPRLQRLLLVGEGSSWRDAQCAAPVFRQSLPGVLVNVYRPVELLNLGPAIDPQHDLAVEISWSGTTDAVLKVDNWLREMAVLRIVVTGRPQSDLGRRGLTTAGTLNVMTGVEVSVATVKGFTAILFVLDLLAGQLSAWQVASEREFILDELAFTIPQHLQTVADDRHRRQQIRQAARRCAQFNKVVVVGDSPVDIEAELKIEELAQVVARTIDFHAASLRALIESSAWAPDDAQRILFIINATTPEAHRAARPALNYMAELDVFCLVHTTIHSTVSDWQQMENCAVFLSPAVSPALQPLIDASFFFDLAVALAYARGLSADEIDRPRNLAKSVTTTGAERRAAVENQPLFPALSLAEFAAANHGGTAWNAGTNQPSATALQATMALRAALAILAGPLPADLTLQGRQHLVFMTDAEATEIGAAMSAVAWQLLHGIDIVVYRRFFYETPQLRPDSYLLRLERSGAFLALQDGHTLHLPADLNPLQLEILAATYLTGLAVRLARQEGRPVREWERGLARLPLLLAGMLANEFLAGQIRAVLQPWVTAGYDKVQIIGGGQDFMAADSLAHSLCLRGIMAEALYTDSAWHGPLATVGGPGPEWDTLIIVLAVDPLFQAAALVDTQVYRARNAQVILVVPAGNEARANVLGVDANAVLTVPAGPRPLLPIILAVWGAIVADQFTNCLKIQKEDTNDQN